MPLRIIRADITKLETDAIVNAANDRLAMGGGVCGAIFHAAGPSELQSACDKIGSCPTGQAVITPGFKLPARYVIHTCGPVWHGGHQGEERLLRSCYLESLRLAARHELTSIAFPLISAGIYGYPRPKAMQVAVSAISEFLTDERNPDLDVTLALFDHCSVREYSALFGRITSYLDDNDPALRHYEAEYRTRKDRNAPSAPPPEVQAMPAAAPSAPRSAPAPASLADKFLAWAKAHPPRRQETFSQMLLRFIDRTGEKDPVIYKRANVDRRLFSKIRNDPHYQPGKNTVLAFCLALRLSLPDAKALLGCAGYALSPASRLDLAVTFCLENGVYDVHQVNLALYELDLPPLGV